MTREEIVKGLEVLATDLIGAVAESGNKYDTYLYDTVSNAIRLLDGKKHRAIWQDKTWLCPVCGMKLNPSFQKECPDCHIRIIYKKGGE